MPRDIEDLLRESLAARAQDVTPDPDTFSRVQRRIRRGRIWRLSAAGGVAVATLVLLAVVVPTLRSQRVEFVPAPPVASQPAAPSEEPVPAPALDAGGMVFTDGKAVYAMALDGESADELYRPSDYLDCVNEEQCGTISDIAVRPGSTRSSMGALVRTADGCGALDWVTRAPDGDGWLGSSVPVEGADCATSAAFSPDGDSAGWLERPDVTGCESCAELTLETVDWLDDGPGNEDAAFGIDMGGTRARIEDWVWTSTGAAGSAGFVYLAVDDVGDDADDPRVFRIAVERQSDDALGIPSGETEPLVSSDGYQPWAYAQDANAFSVDVRFDDEGRPEAARVSHRDDDVVTATLDLPADVVTSADEWIPSNFWIDTLGNAVLYGDGTGDAWTVTWDGEAFTEPIELGPTIVQADLLAADDAPVGGTEPAAPTTTTVEVYFALEENQCLSEVDVHREVQTPAVARGALNALLAGPTPQEQNEGLTSPFSAATADALLDVTVDKGVATVDLMHLGEWFDADPCTGDLVHSAIERTLLQFPTVQDVRVTFDGSARLYRDWIESGGPAEEDPVDVAIPEPVLVTAEQIRSAAAARDYEALDALIDPDQFTCTFGDASTPCVEQWQAQEEEGLDPLGVLVEILEQEPAQVQGAQIWTYPAAHARDPEYLGPRTGVDEDGIWRYYQQGGD